MTFNSPFNADKRMDHHAYPLMLRRKTDSELRYIAKDAGEAVRANPSTPNNSFYENEILYCYAELFRRGGA
jgi:hypothetical protein